MSSWMTHEDEYWAGFDALIDAVERLHLYAIPSLGYCLQGASNAVFGLNETMNDCMRNESSVGFAMEIKYYK